MDQERFNNWKRLLKEDKFDGVELIQSKKDEETIRKVRELNIQAKLILRQEEMLSAYIEHKIAIVKAAIRKRDEKENKD
ncbi:hypothetical protein A3Q56_07194 [Intoshia linei]|uniref:Uncharacterized protein n=1 Tax=Intoshia linei TaxID=1819745 RepID=A0A177AUM4_9BILA|nr:hypothetical protein A3Q56_07194 [Intoshia linei]